MTTVEIPNRPAFKAQEVCELAEIQPYVLRTWEAEFPDLGVAKSAHGPRIYRRTDVERVLRIKHLLFVDGLTLAGARRKLGDEGPRDSAAVAADADVGTFLDPGARQQLREVRDGLEWILGVLTPAADRGENFSLTAGEDAKAAKTKKARGRAGTASS